MKITIAVIIMLILLLAVFPVISKEAKQQKTSSYAP